MLREITDETYVQFIENTDTPVLLDFYSPTCGPCQALMGMMEQIAAFYSNETIAFARIDVSRNPKLAKKYQIRSVPLVCIVDTNKKIAFAEEGLRDRNTYVAAIDKLLSPKRSFWQKLFG